jgi:hypothetical protein
MSILNLRSSQKYYGLLKIEKDFKIMMLYKLFSISKIYNGGGTYYVAGEYQGISLVALAALSNSNTSSE